MCASGSAGVKTKVPATAGVGDQGDLGRRKARCNSRHWNMPDFGLFCSMRYGLGSRIVEFHDDQEQRPNTVVLGAENAAV